MARDDDSHLIETEWAEEIKRRVDAAEAGDASSELWTSSGSASCQALSVTLRLEVLAAEATGCRVDR